MIIFIWPFIYLWTTPVLHSKMLPSAPPDDNGLVKPVQLLDHFAAELPFFARLVQCVAWKRINWRIINHAINCSITSRWRHPGCIGASRFRCTHSTWWRRRRSPLQLSYIFRGTKYKCQLRLKAWNWLTKVDDEQWRKEDLALARACHREMKLG